MVGATTSSLIATAPLATALPRLRTVGLMAGLMLGVLLALMDQTVVSTALPTIVGQLGGLGRYTWVFSAYALAQTASLPIFGRLSDLYGQRRLFLAGTTIFLLGSSLCGQARTMEQLILFRGLQGVGGAGLMPVALAMLGTHYAPEARARLQGILGSAAGLAVIVGPSVGSLIVEHTSWRWVFYVNLPLGALSALAVVLSLPGARARETVPTMDYVGALSLIGWVVSLMLAVFYSRDYAWGAPLVLGLLLCAGLLLTLFLVHEWRTRAPILPLRIFAHPTVAAAGAVTFIRAVATYALIIYTPLLVQGVWGGTSEQARTALTVFALPAVLGAVAAGFLVARRVGYRSVMAGGLVLSGAGLWLVTRLSMQTNLPTGQNELLRDLALAGFGVGVTQVTIILAIQHSVAREHMGIASSLAQFLNNLAGTAGVSLLGAYQAARLADGVRSVLATPALRQLPPPIAERLAGPAAVGQALTNPAAAAQLPPQLIDALREALAVSLHGVFQVGLALTALALLVSLLMRGSAGDRVEALASAGVGARPRAAVEG